jgi:hypothetical protein
MYDALTSQFTFSCPVLGESRVRLSAFRRLERLPGAVHPAVFAIRFACPCGRDHPGLVAHDELDWAPLGLGGGHFLNLMTAKLEELALELADLAARRIGAGTWPWSFFCYPEEQPRPVFPSSFLLLAPNTSHDAIGVAVRCPVCTKVSVNLVSSGHVDLPFVNDREIGVVPHVFGSDAAAAVEEFGAELHSSSFDARRLHLH